ncbi:ExbD/TolR family protein [Sphingorhabdus sp. SMR4y]|uniref:ExbD/TolR family protein n=1 Tax=Sphingorhabdus sp. SMR4y TaxID=2584094 RepID=UPI000B61BB5B|nr:biopolymer transporter ExbD [Sphingorhabdus sp. SMR4y]ASK89867.1 biopolymer transport protein ExbD [Sphingorhabdus sp. SMR4y]
MRSRKSHLRQTGPAVTTDKPFADLNITPLIDVLLVLLVMMMLSIPAATHKVEVDLPAGTLGSRPSAINKLFLNSAGTAIWNGIPMDSDRLRGRLEMMARDPAKPQLHFESDARARYERFDNLVAMIKMAGVEQVAFIGNQQFAHWDNRD